MIVAGIGSRKGVSAAEVIAAVEAALEEHGLTTAGAVGAGDGAHEAGRGGIFAGGRST